MSKIRFTLERWLLKGLFSRLLFAAAIIASVSITTGLLVRLRSELAASSVTTPAQDAVADGLPGRSSRPYADTGGDVLLRPKTDAGTGFVQN